MFKVHQARLAMQQIVLVRERVRRIKRASPLGRHEVRVTWEDNYAETKDLQPLVHNSRSHVALRSNDALFSTVAVSEDGSQLVWSNGLSLTASAIARLPNNAMDAAELRAIMAHLGYSSEGLACMLGLSRRAITDYRGGASIPKYIALAVRYLQDFSGR